MQQVLPIKVQNFS